MTAVMNGLRRLRACAPVTGGLCGALLLAGAFAYSDPSDEASGNSTFIMK